MDYIFIRGYKFSYTRLMKWFGSEKEVFAWIDKTINAEKRHASSECDFHYWFDRFIIK